MNALNAQLRWYVLEPLDILLMREAKPFTSGDGSWAKGIFPPPPITVFQALRSATTRQEVDRQRYLNFLGPFLLQEAGSQEAIVWIPTPKDLLSSYENETDVDEGDGSKEAPAHWDKVAQLEPLVQDTDSTTPFGFSTDHFVDGLTPMVPPSRVVGERKGYGRTLPWMKATALVKYLRGQLDAISKDDFCDNPWTTQVLPHIQVTPGTRQVKSEDGYFTEVAIRIKPGWKLVAGLSADLTETIVRLGGEGHRVLVTPLPHLKVWEELQPFTRPQPQGKKAYLLMPGLAEVESETGPEEKQETFLAYSVYPDAWKGYLHGCVSDRPLLLGGMSVFQKPGEVHREAAFTPQRAFVPPGTVYRFKTIPDRAIPLLPKTGGSWLETFEKLGYGTLLWSQS
jgi:CRISPR-associated protein Cmr3